MTSALTRRHLLRTAAAGAAVVGWSAVSGSWVTAGASPAPSVDPVPQLDGSLETSPAVLAKFSTDFGDLVDATPKAVLRPGSVQDIVKMVQYARRNGLKIAMNGQSGTGDDLESHSNYGQSAVPGGISIDSKGLSAIHSIGPDYADVETGVAWSTLVDAALAKGLTPPSLTDYIRLSVGGTISIGGIGGTVQKYGLQCDTVQEIDVVTGEGRLVTASPTVRPDLFNAVVAGAGQCGIIVRAKLKLVPAPAKVRVFELRYHDLATYLADSEKLLRDGRFTHQEGQIARKADDSGWDYTIEGGAYFTPPTAPDDTALLAGLHDDRAALQVQESDYRDWAFRLDAFEQSLKAGNYWHQPHPWLSLIVPASTVKQLADSVLAEVKGADLGVGFCFLYPFYTSKLTRPLFALPEPAEPVAYLFDLLRLPVPNDTGIDRMLAQNRRFYDRAVALGAKRYLVGAVPGLGRADWRRHFGRHWDGFAAAKRRYDPDHVLTPGQGFFA
jgi:FAD/FMN-containing dehydrogenase